MRLRMMERIRRHRSALLLSFFRVLTYGCLTALFFGLMAIYNWPLRHPSRTLATTALTFGTMMLVMNAVYGGYAVGKRKSKPVISSMSLSILATDAVTYLQLQIMNVNDNNNTHLELFGPDFPLLLLCIVLQIAVIILWVRLGSNMYFSVTPPSTCLLVLGQEAEKPRLLRRMNIYRLQWQVTDTALYSDADLAARIAKVETVVLGEVPEDRRNAVLQMCYAQQKNVLCCAALEDIMVSNGKQLIIDDAPFLEISASHMTLNQRIVKRLMDLVVSGLGLVLLSPLLGVISLCIYLEDGGPVIFRQQRVTLRGRIFTIYKFRTMRKDACVMKHQVSASKGDPRITRVGGVLRRCRLDELPQLVNIFHGDMTLVGPRPEMVENVEKYKAQYPAFVYRERMKAGLTGYAQIEGKYNTTPEDKLMLDLMYIESFSIWLDVKLLFRTLTVFFKADSTEGFDAPASADTKHDKSLSA